MDGDQPMNIETSAEVTRSADGTSIGFVRLGAGPAVVFVHGSLSTSDDWRQVATAMAGQFTCFLLDRRGRGRSGDASDYSIDREYEDIKAVLDVAGPGVHLLGHSYGAICALGAALGAPIGRLVLYEPPLPVEGPVVGAALAPYRAAVSGLQLDEALMIGLRDIVHLSAEEIAALRPTPLWKQMAALTPTWMREMEAVDRLGSSLERYRQLEASTLLLLGTATAAHHQVATTALAKTLPAVRVVHLQGEGHVAHLTVPDMVAKEVTDFLLAHR
jgi:pimeloyl-ACP methyl ester carboxylesterase